MGEDRRGQVFENPVSGERVVVLTDPEHHPERVLVSHLNVQPGGRVAIAHRHPTLTERFHVLKGEVGLLIERSERLLGPGEAVEVPPDTVHDWWQVGEREAQVIVEVSPGDRFVEMVGTMFGLARDGRCDKRGLPHPLQLAVTAQNYSDVMVVTSPPPPVQRVLFAVLAPIGRLFGRRASYPQYLASKQKSDPDPAALALLSPDGRLRFERGQQTSG